VARLLNLHNQAHTIDARTVVALSSQLGLMLHKISCPCLTSCSLTTRTTDITDNYAADVELGKHAVIGSPACKGIIRSKSERQFDEYPVPIGDRKEERNDLTCRGTPVGKN